MQYTDAIEELGKLAQALVIEREDELKMFQSIQEERSIKERCAEGVSIHPLKVINTGISFGSYPFLLLGRNKGDDRPTQIQTGSSISLFRTSETETERYKGRVLFADDQQVKVLLFKDDLPEGVREGRWGIDLMFDDRTFDEMAKALSELINTEDRVLMHLRDVILGYKRGQMLPAHQLELPHLNEDQNAALNLCMQSQEVAVIHGPPGTGKTSSLVSVIKQMKKDLPQVLVTAPSNTAVDVLTTRLIQEGLKVVRIGNASKIEESNLDATLDQLIRQHRDFKMIRDFHKRADEMRSMASKYKRNFGHAEREQRKLLFNESKQLRKAAKDQEMAIISSVLDQADVITCTFIGSADWHLKDRRFPCVFVDEAGQGLEPGAWVPILKADKVILAGDPQQLPPTVKSERAEKMGLSVSLIEKVLTRQSDFAILLRRQYRMNERIMGFSSEHFYNNQLIADDSVKDQLLHPDQKALEWIDTAGCGFEESSEHNSSSKSNPEEAALLCRHFEALKASMNGQAMEVGIISPYRAQVKILRDLLKGQEVSIQSVDGFQGQEKEVIYVSLVRSNQQSNIGFLKDYRRMNVALTRARKKLVVIGDSATLGNDPFFSAFLDYAEKNDAYHSAWEWMS